MLANDTQPYISTKNSLLQWFQSAPSKTCPQCRKQVNRLLVCDLIDLFLKMIKWRPSITLDSLCFQVSTRHIINKLFFDIAPEDDSTSVDPESLQVINPSHFFYSVYSNSPLSVKLTLLTVFYCFDFRMTWPEWKQCCVKKVKQKQKNILIILHIHSLSILDAWYRLTISVSAILNEANIGVSTIILWLLMKYNVLIHDFACSMYIGV